MLIDKERLRQQSSEMLKQFVAYWATIPEERKKRYFNDVDTGISMECEIEGEPARMSLKLVRTDLSGPTRVFAAVSGGGVQVQISAFKITNDEIVWCEDYVEELVKGFEVVYEELRYELNHL